MKEQVVTLRRHRDDTHHWVEVPVAIMADLPAEVIDQVSPFSAMDRGAVYLEGDTDAPLVMAALQEAGVQVAETELRHATAPHRALCGRYDPHFVRHPLRDGDRVLLADGETAEVRFVADALVVRRETGEVNMVRPLSRYTEYVQGVGEGGPRPVRDMPAPVYTQSYVQEVDPGLQAPVTCRVEVRMAEDTDTSRAGVWKVYQEPGGQEAEVHLTWTESLDAAVALVQRLCAGKPQTVEAFLSGEATAIMPHLDDDMSMQP